MKFVTIFEKYQDWFEGTWVIHTALRIWTTLIVDPSGDVLPLPTHNRQSPLNNLPNQTKYHSPKQKKKWDKLNQDFYNRIMKRANKCEDTFSKENINLIREYLSNTFDDGSTARDKIPTNKIATKIRQPHHIDEQLDGLLVAEYMLQLDQTKALIFLENLSIYWAANLPIPEDANPYLEHGRYLYHLAEQME